MQWTTRDAGTPTVMYGTSSGALTQMATGNTTTYTHERERTASVLHAAVASP